MSKKLRDTYHKIGELLVRRNLAPAAAIDEALAIQRSHIEQHRTPPRLGEILIERKILDRKLIKEILQEQLFGRGQKKVLKIDLKDADGVAVVVLEGRLDETKEEPVTKVFERLMNRGFARIAVDCSKLIYLNSHGISSFVSYIDEARARGGDMKFFGMSADSKFVMERLGLSNFVQTFAKEDEALKAFELPIDEYMSRGALAEYVSTESRSERLYHLSYCTTAQKIHEEDRVYFESKWHARNSGKLPCKRCKP
jgi:anti-sigma B factor antagonist/stage II sporulation protein AA (anti-sigma F factor antagonist)